MTASQPIGRGEQVYLSYGPLPNMLLLTQFGFVVPALPTDAALVRCDALSDGPSGSARAEELAREGMLMREADGAPSAWQPAGPALHAALTEVARSGDLPAALAADASPLLPPEQAGAAAYLRLLQASIDAFSTSLAEDDALLLAPADGAPPLPPRARLAVQFRREQKALLRREVARVRALRAA